MPTVHSHTVVVAPSLTKQRGIGSSESRGFRGAPLRTALVHDFDEAHASLSKNLGIRFCRQDRLKFRALVWLQASLVDGIRDE